jgi:hypothetical protein
MHTAIATLHGVDRDTCNAYEWTPPPGWPECDGWEGATDDSIVRDTTDAERLAVCAFVRSKYPDRATWDGGDVPTVEAHGRSLPEDPLTVYATDPDATLSTPYMFDPYGDGEEQRATRIIALAGHIIAEDDRATVDLRGEATADVYAGYLKSSGEARSTVRSARECEIGGRSVAVLRGSVFANVTDHGCVEQRGAGLVHLYDDASATLREHGVAVKWSAGAEAHGTAGHVVIDRSRQRNDYRVAVDLNGSTLQAKL